MSAKFSFIKIVGKFALTASAAINHLHEHYRGLNFLLGLKHLAEIIFKEIKVKPVVKGKLFKLFFTLIFDDSRPRNS